MKLLKTKMCLAAALCGFLVVGCAPSQPELTETQKIVQEASQMSYAELVAKAKEEVGENVVKTYGNSSQLEKALTAFTESTGIKVENSKDFMYEELYYEEHDIVKMFESMKFDEQ